MTQAKIRNLYDADGNTAPDAQWVLDGHGEVSLLYADVTMWLNSGDQWYERFDAGSGDALPEGFEPAHHMSSGGMVGWVPNADDSLPDPQTSRPGVYLREPSGTLTRSEDAEVLAERGSRNVKRLLSRAREHGAVGVVFRLPTGEAFKVRV